MPEPACLPTRSSSTARVAVGFHRGRRVPPHLRRPASHFGKAASELTGRSIAEVLDGELAVEWKDRLTRALEGETLLLRLRRDASNWAILVSRFAS